jgi:hypothetical protein
VALAAASYAASHCGLPTAMLAASYAGTALLAGTFLVRWAAVPALLVAAIGLAAVFVSYVQSSGSVTWSQSSAMVAYGLAMIATLMILVERKDETCESS